MKKYQELELDYVSYIVSVSLDSTCFMHIWNHHKQNHLPL